MRRVLTAAALLVAAAGLSGLWVTRAAGLGTAAQAALAASPGDAERGATVFHAAGCASCHAAPDAEWSETPVLSGGQAFETAFGTFHAPNVSTDAARGIGGWTLAQFADAVQAGVSPDGAHYYPAFPYAAYRLAEPQDVADLWAFWQGLPPSDAESLPHDLAFPFSIRRGVGVWKALALRDGWFTPEPSTEDAAHGRYLAEALAHCGECHTPRDAFGIVDRDRWLQGAPNPSGRGTIPAIAGSRLDWSEAEIAAYLKDGFTPDFDSAGGHMAKVVLNLARLTDADRSAIAAYLKALD